MTSHGDLLAFLARQERTILSKIGAGIALDGLVNRRRWARELSQDLHLEEHVAGRYVDREIELLNSVIAPLKKRSARVVAARVVFAELRSRMPAWDNEQVVAPVGDHMVYILRDARDLVLYVGITDRGPRRLVEHYRKKPWFERVCRVEFERYETRAASEAREKYLITNLAPMHNVQHNLGRHHRNIA